MSRRELLKGSTETLLLSLLASGPKYGYQIVKEMEQRSHGYFSFREGTLYPALHRMERAGLIEGRWEPSPTGQMRRYYHITDKGRKHLQTLQQEWHAFARAVSLVILPEQA
ncbi:MAG: helix-turn-helix transcriptional regulator [Dehalococcoidia bacterium]|nr:helix-turn-helix transcriptional regulator [Dehalococcoidia bacterium]MDW8119143.1 helix-turn-helix transcriptional regulator [Chloroflexota bacterium]